MLFSHFIKVQMWTLPTSPPLSILCQPGVQPLPTQHPLQHPWRPHSHLPDVGPSSSPGTPAPWSSRPRLVCPPYPSKSGVPLLWGSSLGPPSTRASLEGPPDPHPFLPRARHPWVPVVQPSLPSLPSSILHVRTAPRPPRLQTALCHQPSGFAMSSISTTTRSSLGRDLGGKQQLDHSSCFHVQDHGFC